MPTISQLPVATSVSAADELPISQGGTARAASVGALLASTQPAIVVDSPSLVGRTSLGSGAPEQVDVGLGVKIESGALLADGRDHAAFPSTSALAADSDLVISNQGSPMLMQTSLLRGLFSAGQNVEIDPNGVISTTGSGTISGTIMTGSSIGALHVVSGLSAQDLVAVSHAGSDCAIEYGNLLDGVTIDQAQSAASAGDLDTIWVAQGSNVMTSQTFANIWRWVANKLPTYKTPITEIAVNTNLDMTVHNGRILVCSQPVTLSPLVNNMGSGFQCTVINASSGTVTLGSGFVSSSGSLTLASWQAATLSCATYSGGTIAFAAMPNAGPIITVPGQVGGLASSGVTATTIALSWQPPSTGGAASSYVVQFRQTGTSFWSSTPPITGATAYQISGLQPGTSYDIAVTAQNAAGTGAASTILTVATAASGQPTAPPQITGVTATPTSSNTVQLSWSPQTGSNAATSCTVQYRMTGAQGWTFSLAGIVGTTYSVLGLAAATSYDFCVIGVNSVGVGTPSVTVTAVTGAASAAVTSITWNMLPSGSYAHGSGTVGINAHISPGTSPVRFGFSLSSSVPPTSWTAAILVNTDLWGAYVPTPPTAGYWYVWGEGLDGSAPTVAPSSFLVQ